MSSVLDDAINPEVFREGIKTLIEELEAHYKVKFNFDNDYLNYPNFKNEGKYTELSFQINICLKNKKSSKYYENFKTQVYEELKGTIKIGGLIGIQINDMGGGGVVN